MGQKTNHFMADDEISLLNASASKRSNRPGESAKQERGG
jgi:hypothetical protein